MCSLTHTCVVLIKLNAETCDKLAVEADTIILCLVEHTTILNMLTEPAVLHLFMFIMESVRTSKIVPENRSHAPIVYTTKDMRLSAATCHLPASRPHEYWIQHILSTCCLRFRLNWHSDGHTTWMISISLTNYSYSSVLFLFSPLHFVSKQCWYTS